MKTDLRFSAAPALVLVALLPAALLPAACADMPPPPPARTAPPVATGSTVPFRFGELTTGSMRRGMQIGRYVWGFDCAPPYDDVHWTSGVNMRRGSTFEERFSEVMTAAGFDVVGRPGGPDSPDGNRSRARYTVLGDLRDVQLELCHRTNWLTGGDKGSSGIGSVKVEWTVYDARGGGMVHRAVTSGAVQQDRGVPQGDTLLVEEAFAAAAESFAADPGFRALLSGASPPISPPASPPASSSTSPRLPMAEPAPVQASMPAPMPIPVQAGAGSAPVALLPAASPPAAGPGAGRLLLNAGGAAVRVSSARLRVGDGYGLVVGDTLVEGESQAVVLAQVPGSDPTVAVRPARGVELTGRVVGRDAASGFALLRVPARLPALPLRLSALRVSEPVLAAPRAGGRGIAGIVGGITGDDVGGDDVGNHGPGGGAGRVPPDPARIRADLGTAALFAATTEAGDPLLDASGALAGVAPPPGRSAGARAAVPEGLVDFLPIGPLLDRLGADPVGSGARRAAPAGRGLVEEEPDGGPGGTLDGDGAPPT
ncbi:serine protease [Azospirillum picis]|uniref:Serine protease n=1 Tax=Azospirillum picis TaxID=488438 RepID=A0ABU0ML69_9PROT|nr:serine protease [Azospirillum picis]MBP2300371.1 hypothetical protein [Azospirillum picis]MDQ0534167.1 hypothetical protein [Azospirillum picis]